LDRIVTSRQRGAALLLAALVIGRILDRFDPPFERREAQPASPDSLVPAGAAPSVATPASPRIAPAVRPAGAVAGGDSGALQPAAAPAARADDAPPIAINRASAADLQRLPGVGPVLAERIVADRAAHGPFRDATDLQRVRGIGTKSAARLAPRLRFD
jgi:competence protein ComEA